MQQEHDRRIWVGLSTTDTFLGKAIRWFTGQRASHAWVSFYDETMDLRLVMDASASGYRVKPLFSWLDEMGPTIKRWTFVTDLDLWPGVQMVARSIGTPYDRLNFLWHAFRRWFGRWLTKPLHSPNKLLCSEAVVRIMRFSQVPGSLELDPEATTPGDLLEWLEDSFDFYRIDDVP